VSKRDEQKIPSTDHVWGRRHAIVACLAFIAVCGQGVAAAVEATEKLTGCEIERVYVDKGYRGHNASNPHRVFISGQKRGGFGVIKREFQRRSLSSP
jgi:hypothetical protein